MDAKSSLKVGGVVILAAAAFAAMYLFLAHLSLNRYDVRVAFPNTRGLMAQGPVRMEGVQIGEVKEIRLNTSRRPPQPVVTLAIDNRYSIPRDSVFRVETGLLILNPQVYVEPGMDEVALPKNGSAWGRAGEAPGSLAAISPELAQTVRRLNREFTNLDTRLAVTTDKIDRALDTTNSILKNTNATVVSVRSLVANQRLRASLITTLDNFKQVSADAKQTSHDLARDLRELAHNTNTNLQKLSSRMLDDVLPRVENTIDNANSVVQKLTEEVTDPRLTQSLRETAELARTTLARFNQIASDIHQITGDPALQTSVRQTVMHLDEATSRGEQTMEKVDTLLDKLNGPVRHPHLPAVQILGNVSEQLNPGRLRVDVDARIANAVDFGFYDLGQDTRLNLQGITPLTGSLFGRYGLYASKLGVGLDYSPSSAVGFRADLFNTNRPRLDLRALFRVNNSTSVWLGGDGLFRQPVPIFGVQFTH